MDLTSRPLAALLLLAALALPAATAAGTLDAVVLTVHVEDSFGRACPYPVAGFCLFLVQDDGSPGNLTLDAYQRLDYVGVATDFSLFRQHLGDLWLLPDGGMTVRGSDLYVPHPVFSTATQAWTQTERPAETDRVGMTQKNVSVVYPMPSFASPGALDSQYWAMGYGEGMEYDRLGPFNTPDGNSTDAYYWAGVEAFCPQDGRCGPVTSGAVALAPALAPAARVGLEFYDIQVATDPANLTPPAPAAAMVGKALPAARAPTGGAVEAEEEEEAAPAEEPLPEGPAPAPTRPRAAAPEPTRPDGGVRVLGKAPLTPPADLPLEVILGATAAGILLVALGAALYSRFQGRADVLRSGTRDRLVELIRQNPGICLTDAAEAMGLARNAIQHHVRMLERAQVVRVGTESKRRTLYLVGVKAADAPPAWLLKNPACATIVRAAQESPAGLPREAVQRLLPEMPERTRNYNIQKLLAVGALVQVETPEGAKVLRPASASAASAS